VDLLLARVHLDVVVPAALEQEVEGGGAALLRADDQEAGQAARHAHVALVELRRGQRSHEVRVHRQVAQPQWVERLVVAEGVGLQEGRLALAHALVVPRAVFRVSSAHLAARILHDKGDLVLPPHWLCQPPLPLLPLACVVHPVAVHCEVTLE